MTSPTSKYLIVRTRISLLFLTWTFFLVAHLRDYPHLISLNISHCKDADCQRIDPQYSQEPITDRTEKFEIRIRKWENLTMILHCDHWMDMNHYKICKRCPPVSLDLYINNHQIPQNHKSLNHKLCRLFYCLFCCRCRWSCCCRWPRHCRCRCQCWRRQTVLGNDHQRNMTVEWAQYWTLEVEGPLNFLCLIYTAHTLTAESEKPRQRVSNADRKVFAKSSLLAEEFPDILENVRILYKISR